MGQQLTLGVQPLSHGNASARALRASVRDQTPEDRVEEALELSAFLTDVAAAGRRSGGSR